MEIAQFKFDDDSIGILLSVRDFNRTIVTELYTNHRQAFDNASLILVRERPEQQFRSTADEKTNPAYQALAERFPDAKIARLSSENYRQILLDGLSNEAFSHDLANEQIIEAVRQGELMHFVHAGKALLPSSPGYYYRLPSGLFASTFLRVGNIQTNTAVLDAMFFWMLPYLKNVSGILIDTWSISSIALNAARLLPIYDSARADRIGFEILPRYADLQSSTSDETLAAARRVSDDFQRRFLLLYSASMSGKSLTRTLTVLQGAATNHEHVLPLVLYEVGRVEPAAHSAVQSLCRLDQQITIGGSESFPGDLTAVEIDANLYFPFGIQECEVQITALHAQPHLEFFSAYGETEAISVHRDSYVEDQKYRHHGIYIDVASLLKTQRFKQRLSEIIAQLTRPDLMIVPPHGPGRKLAEESAALFGGEVPIVESSDLREPDVVQRIRDAGADARIMVVDDVVTTGTRLRTFQRRLRADDVCHTGVIYYLVGVSRMQTEIEWQRLTQSLTRRLEEKNQVLPVEKIVLPDWDEHTCPWCQESRKWDEALSRSKSEGSFVMKERASLLRSTDRGLLDKVFLSSPCSAPLKIGGGSVFAAANARQSVVAAAVAASLQMLRSDGDETKRLNPERFPVRYVLALSTIETRFTDSILRAAILRCAHPPEMRRADHHEEEKRAKWAREILQSEQPADQDIRREILVAILFDRLPRTVLDSETLALLRESGLAEFVRLFEEGDV